MDNNKNMDGSTSTASAGQGQDPPCPRVKEIPSTSGVSADSIRQLIKRTTTETIVAQRSKTTVQGRASAEAEAAKVDHSESNVVKTPTTHKCPTVAAFINRNYRKTTVNSPVDPGGPLENSIPQPNEPSSQLPQSTNTKKKHKSYEKVNYLCQHCKEIFEYLNQFVRHLNTHHPNTAKPNFPRSNFIMNSMVLAKMAEEAVATGNTEDLFASVEPQIMKVVEEVDLEPPAPPPPPTIHVQHLTPRPNPTITDQHMTKRVKCVPISLSPQLTATSPRQITTTPTKNGDGRISSSNTPFSSTVKSMSTGNSTCKSNESSCSTSPSKRNDQHTISMNMKQVRGRPRKIHDVELSDNPAIPKKTPDTTATTVNKNPEKDTESNLYPCKFCEKIFINSRGLCTHSARMHKRKKIAPYTKVDKRPKKPHSCHCCPKKCTTDQELTVHARAHTTGQKPFKCDKCPGQFATGQQLTIHQRVHLAKKVYTCEYCSVVLETSMKLHNHKRIHKRRNEKPLKKMSYVIKKSYKCEYCSVIFKTSRKLNNHKRIHKRQPQPLKPRKSIRAKSVVNTAKKLYTCKLCGKLFESIGQFICHKREHVGKKFLSYIFPNKSETKALLKHKTQPKGFSARRARTTHTGEKRPYPCDFCDKTFANSSNQRDHRRLHTGERPFVCSVCGKAYPSKTSLFTHTKFQH